MQLIGCVESNFISNDRSAGSYLCPQQDGLLLGKLLFLKPHCSCQMSTLTGMISIKVRTTPERSSIMIENTQKACLIARILAVSYPFNQSPSEGTESITCIDESTTERLANANISGLITLSKYKAVDQYGILQNQALGASRGWKIRTAEFNRERRNWP